MCGGPDQLNSNPQATSSPKESESLTKAMNTPFESGHTFSALFEFVADNDVEGFKQVVVSDSCKIDEVGPWYARQRVLKRTVLMHRTPLMVASTYGSVEIVKLILSLSKEDINRSFDPDKSTALHCAASGGTIEAIDIVKLLLLAGADPNATDCCGSRPLDVVVSPPNLPNLKVALKEMLKSDGLISSMDDLHVSIISSTPSSPSCSSSLENGSLWSPSTKKEYPIDPSIPDISNSIYATDEFRMFSFKIRPCSRSYTHDWTECPFVHPGENARRRDPKKYHYSCVPCPDHRKAPCRRGDLCGYAHGVFESLLHPAQYRTRICKDGTSCARRVCFFAHKPEELRPLYLSTGSAMPSPPHSASSVTAIELAVGNAMSPSSFAPPMSPGNGFCQASMAWPHQNIPTLHLPGNHLQISRMRSSLSARDVQMNLDDISCYSPNRSIHLKDVTPSNGNELFPYEISSSQYSDQPIYSPVFSPSQKSVFINEPRKRESVLSPVQANPFSPKNVDHLLLKPSFQGIEPLSPLHSMASGFPNCLNQHQPHCLSYQDLRSNLPHDAPHNLSCDIGTSEYVSSPVSCWSHWGSPIGKVDWSVQADEVGRLRKSVLTRDNTTEPEVSSVQSLVKESPSDIKAMNAKQIDQVVAFA